MIKLSELKGQKFVRDFRIVLKDIEPYVRAGKPLWHGRDFTNFSLRPREIWALWLLCVVFNWIGKTDLTFGEDDESDGVLVDKRSGDMIKVENVAAMDFPKSKLPKGEDRIIQAIQHKAKKGAKYATGKILVVFFDGAGIFYPNKIAKAVNGKHDFERVYLVGLLNDKGGTEYSYSVLELNEQNTSAAIVKIDPSFSSWSVSGINEAFSNKLP